MLCLVSLLPFHYNQKFGEVLLRNFAEDRSLEEGLPTNLAGGSVHGGRHSQVHLGRGFEPGDCFPLVYGRMGRIISLEWYAKGGVECMVCVYQCNRNGKDFSWDVRLANVSGYETIICYENVKGTASCPFSLLTNLGKIHVQSSVR